MLPPIPDEPLLVPDDAAGAPPDRAALLAAETAAFLCCGVDELAGRAVRIARGTAVVATRRCPGKSTVNEDSCGALPLGDGTGLLVVADGMGGFRGGERASRTVVETLCETALETVRSGSLLRTALLDGIEAANTAVQGLGIGSGSTLAAVEIRDGTVRPYHVGDSLILVVGQRGKIKLQTISHSPVGFALASNLFDEATALQHEERHLVSNFVGTPAMRIEIGGPLVLAPRDTLLLASDGLCDNLRLDEIVERIRKGPLETAVRRLLADAAARMAAPPDAPHPCKPDDLTIVCFRPR
jgi:serine/threonine protein phosphatase PrpC